MGSAEKELLFCDTFVHEGNEELHVDLVRFMLPVVIREVRVVPKDQKVFSFNEIESFGQTIPSSFTLNLYCNDSTNPLAPTFDQLGTIEYSEGSVGLNVKPKTASDLIVVRGFYTVLTLSLYGNIAPPPSAPSPFHRSASPLSASRSGSPYSGSGSRSDSRSGYSDDGRSPEYQGGGASPERRADSRGEGEGDDGGGKRIDSYDDLFEPFSPVNSPDHMFDLSDEELGSTKRATTTPGGYVIEEFSDEEIAFGDEEFDVQDSDSYLYSEDAWLTSSASFNPYQCDFQKLESFPSQTETPHEALLAKLQKTDTTSKRTVPDEASKLRDVVLKPKDSGPSQRWVEVMEEIPSFLYPGLAQLQKRSSAEGKEALQKLVGWTLQCLSLQAAREMPMAVNIRQLKAGMRMVPSIAALGRKCTHMLVKFGVMEELCSLVSEEHMATSLKLLAIRAVSNLLDYPQGVERFLGWGGRRNNSDKETPYRQMLNIIMNQLTVRVNQAASTLLRKAHVYELLANLQEAVDKVVACTPVKSTSALPDDFWNIAGDEDANGMEEDDFGLGEAVEGRRPKTRPSVEEDAMEVGQEGLLSPSGDDVVKEEKPTDQSAEAMEGVEPQEVTPTPVPPDVIARIVSCLEELKKCLEQAAHTVVQSPVKSFPTRLRYFPSSEVDYYPALVRMFKSRRLLECLLVLLTAPTTALDLVTFAAARDLLLYLASSQQGLLFLSSNPPVMNAITRALTQSVESEMPLNALQPLTDFLSGESTDSCTAQNLGFLLIYHLQVMQSLDALKQAPKATMSELESADCLTALHTLYSMTLTPIGKAAVVYILSLEDNVTALLPFVEPKGHRDHDNKLLKSSVSSRYAAVIILQLLQSSVRGDFIHSYGSRLLVVADFFKENSSPTMSDLYNWLHPVKMLANEARAIPALIGLIKESIPQMSCTRPGKANAPILTSLRLLLSCITPPNSAKGGQRDPKWTQATIDVFSAGIVDVLISLWHKLSDTVLPVWSQHQALTVQQANILVLLASFSLRIMRSLLHELVGEAEGQGCHTYRDTRVVAALMSLHMVLCSAPHSGVISNAALEIQSLIVDILAVFTRPEVAVQVTEEKSGIDATGSSWCLMLQELFKHTLAAPHCFLSGAMVLSSLLPLPLPIQSTQSSTPADLLAVQCLRRLWAVHLEPFTEEITELLEMLMKSSCITLQRALRRTCAQLADLSPSLATIIARLIISTIISEVEKQLEQPEEDSQKIDTEEKKTINSCLLRMLTSCAMLCQQPVFKLAALDLLRQKETTETKGFSRFIPLLLFLVQKKETAISAKLCVMTILNALCNSYVSLQSNEMESSQLTDQQLSDCLPGQSQLEHITSAVLGHVTSPDQPLATVALGLKVVISICQYNSGLLHIYGLLPSYLSGFSQLLARVCDAAKSSSPPSPDTLSCISLLLELLQQLLSATIIARLDNSSGGKKVSGAPQPLSLPKPFLKNIVVREEAELLQQLKEAIQESCKEDERLTEELSAPINELLEAFKDITAANVELPSLEHSLWPEMRGLEQQFEARNSIVTTDGDTTSTQYWLATPPHDERELETDTMVVNLATLASETCSGLNLQEELKKQLLPSPPSTPSKHSERKRKIQLSIPEAQKKLKEAMQQRIAMGRRDIFRSRKQNTSRPPSMHVDDFMRGASARPGMGRGGRGGAMGMPYMAHPGFMPPLGGRWMGPGGGVPPGMGQYPRRDIAGLGGLRTWDSRLPQSFLAPHMKPPSAAMRSAMWASQFQDPYSRLGRGRGGRGDMPWLDGGRSNSRPAVGGGRPGDGWKGRHTGIYKRLV